MAIIEKFKVKDVRCFGGSQLVNIRPVTILVGENCAGKTSLLGCYSAWMNFLGQQPQLTVPGPLRMPYLIQPRIDFNAEPYQMGSFADIVWSPQPQSGKKRAQFSMGITCKASDGTMAEIEATFGESGSEPALQEATISFSSGGKIIYRKQKSPLRSGKIVEFSLNRKDTFVITFYEKWQNMGGLRMSADLLNAYQDLQEKSERMSPVLKKFFTNRTMNENFLAYLEKPVDMAPVRSRPKRTYNPMSETYNTEGDDVPMFLMRMARTSKKEWRKLQRELARLGKESGMFKSIGIKELGKSIGDPFQIEFDTGIRKSNIADVGYGVSQILPLLVRIMRRPNQARIERFLLQQSEIHLHPQSEAAFASLIAHSIKNTKGRYYLLETHSDYIVNRMRFEIRQETIRPEDVSLVYHEKTSQGVKLHNITFDEMGNVLNAPSNYRDFFLKESQRLLGV